MPNPQDIAKLYAPAPQINAALAAIFTTGGIASFTPDSRPDLQKVRARVEINTQVSQEKQSYHVFTDSSKRNASFSGQIELSIIAPTQSDNPAESLHLMQAAVARLMSNIVDDLNGAVSDDLKANFSPPTFAENDKSALLPYHQIQRVTGNTFAQTFPFGDGYVISKPVYSLDFGIVKEAWAKVGLTPM